MRRPQWHARWMIARPLMTGWRAGRRGGLSGAASPAVVTRLVRSGVPPPLVRGLGADAVRAGVDDP
jgi:hypothetical protein